MSDASRVDIACALASVGVEGSEGGVAGTNSQRESAFHGSDGAHVIANRGWLCLGRVVSGSEVLDRAFCYHAFCTERSLVLHRSTKSPATRSIMLSECLVGYVCGGRK